MKFARYGAEGQEKPAIIDKNGDIRDLSGHVHDLTGDILSPDSLGRLGAIDTATLPLVGANERLGPCVGAIGKFMCIGLNYADHAAETGTDIPKNPILFMKATSAVVGPCDDVILPRGSSQSDWEVELGVIIGRPCKYATLQNALDHVAGYCVINDVSERYFQTQLTGQWTKGKSCDTFGPTGPWLVTKDEVGDPQRLDLYLDLNGERQQTGHTRNMIFSVTEIIVHLSQMFTLHPGDVISTGTPPGVGMSKKPEPVYLKEGDVMELGISKLGVQRQTVYRDH